MSLVTRSADYLAARGIGNARREAEWIFAETLSLSRLDLYTKFDMPLADSDVTRLRELVQRRGRREPLAYVLGSQEFYGLRLRVGAGVLVPRPETEELVRHVVATLPALPCAVVDIGTGSGAIALAIKQARPDCRVVGVDKSEAALAYARSNATTLGLDVEFRLGDLGFGLTERFAAVIANLPYIAEEEWAECDPELAFEPREALIAADGGMAVIVCLLSDARRLLVADGVLWLEHGWRQAAAVGAASQAHGFSYNCLSDLAGHERFARLQPVST